MSLEHHMVYRWLKTTGINERKGDKEKLQESDNMFGSTLILQNYCFSEEVVLKNSHKS